MVIMRHQTTIAAALAFAIAPTLASPHGEAGGSESALRQPKETNAIDLEILALGWTPQVTAAPPRPRYAMMARDDGFIKPDNVCGYRKDGFILNCFDEAETCVYESPYGGCCSGPGCSNIPTTCIDYTDVLAGKCNPKTFSDSHTACCERDAPNCIVFNLAMKDNTVKIFGCSTGTGSGGILALTDPKSRTPLTTQSASSSSTSSSGVPTETNSDNDSADKGNDNNNSKGAPVGAIVGGVVGGIGAVALIAVAILLFLRRKNNIQPAKTNDQSPPQKGSPQGQSATPSQAYNHQGAVQGYYTPETAAQQPQEYNRQGYSPVPRNESEFAPPHQWNSPTPVSSVLGAHQSVGSGHQVVGELPAINPSGSPENRAELG